MKKYILFIMFISLFIYGCDDDDNNKGNIDPVTNVECTPFIGSVTLNWTNSTEADYYYTLISYQNSQGENVNKKVSKYSADTSNNVSVVVGGFTDTEEHEFVLTSYGYSGASSSSVTVKGIPLGIEKAKDYVIETVGIESASGGAKITWTNETFVGVDLIVSYLDKKNVEQVVTINATQTGAYTVTGFIAETKLTVCAVNQLDGSKSVEREFMITPTIDPDDIVYPDVEYVTFQANMNDMTLVASNPENSNEYTIVTTGGDPYIYSNGLSAAKEGSTMVFRYKSTKSIKLQIFWCTSSSGPSEANSTTIEFPAAEEWTTFEQDYTAGMATVGWGSSGDYMRCDFGTNADVTINIRNIRFK
ncbi:DUF4959 domain-containing protein [Parabacteroides faecis]|uniref:DUF4959 domain-containing protein n=1 Tax=Parabacteroides TaxID=375288 RepID=UPI000F0006A2|nr:MULTISPECIES: DUF4959 domain-containing protein [Parabacteroides]MBC8618633.1 DUF4959 domain-containing protein [Parabacteroides faecis]RHR97847.1 DUF4959 domain-containing protein [Parabacteroides sp. AF14-59]